MRAQLPTILLAATASAALANFAVLFYNNWYFASGYWPKAALLALLLTPLYFALLSGAWHGLWRALAWYWLAVTALFMLGNQSADLSLLSFTGGMNLEVPMVWIPSLWIAIYSASAYRRTQRAALLAHRATARGLALRRRLRHRAAPAMAAAPPASLIDFPAPETAYSEEQSMYSPELIDYPMIETQPEPINAQAADEADPAEDGQPGRFKLLGLLLPLAVVCGLGWGQPARAEGVDSTEPWHRPDRHNELKDESLRWNPEQPGVPAVYPAPLESRERETFYIVIENKADGAVRVLDKDGVWHVAGRVLSPVRKVNPQGFTASGWAAPGTVCATAVNAMHIKTRHDYSTGRSSVFSILPIEFAEFDPKNYKSYYSATASLVTDIPAGSGIFGGQWAPLVNSHVYVGQPGWEWGGAFESGSFIPEGARPLAEDYAPAEGDVLVIAVARHKYNPEYIEFENRFGGIIWVKEVGLDAYPVGQVLKPVAGAGRFGGSLYAGQGRIRANHPGVICISTSEDGQVGGFQIIPRDHSMSSEMTSARTKTQWMVVGPLWAFDPSWEGLPPLFTDYLYPSYVPLSGKLKDGTVVTGADVFLSRFTVRARYSDSKSPEEYELLHPTAPLTFEALKNMTHLRIYFPRD